MTSAEGYSLYVAAGVSGFKRASLATVDLLCKVYGPDACKVCVNVWSFDILSLGLYSPVPVPMSKTC